MNLKATVVDYGVGNLLSVCRAFEHCGAKIDIAESPEQILNADRLILPGVGAFADAMKNLRSRGFIEAIQQYSHHDRPFLGICLGMQMMLSESEEFGQHDGLDLIAGTVVQIDPLDSQGFPQKVPHIGWNQLVLPAEKEGSYWEHSILSGIPETTSMYFVHSFTALPINPDNRFADAYYGGRRVSAVIRRNNLYGCQFHPEKSGPMGLKIIKNFLAI